MLTCPWPTPVDRPELRQAAFQDIGRYVLRWEWRPAWGEWRCTNISIAELEMERADAIIDWEAMKRWQRDGLPPEAVAHAKALAAIQRK